VRLATLVCALTLAGCTPTGDTDAGSGTSSGTTSTSVDPASAYPEGPYSIAPGGVLPDLAFEGVTEAGVPGDIHLHDYHASPSAAPEILVVTVHGGLWCGTCRWHAAHPPDLSAFTVAGALRRLDVVVGNRDNAPATAHDAEVWRQTFHPGENVAVGVDPSFTLGAVLAPDHQPLPLFLLVDTRTMRVASVLSNPDGAELALQIATALGSLGDNPSSAPPTSPTPPETLVDGTFHQNEWDLLRETTLPAAPPPDPTNAVADSPLAAAFGKALFFDDALSPSGTVSCATCHDAAKHLSDDLPVAQGLGALSRRTPSIALSAHARWQFWDGRADTLWGQALGPLEAPAEFGSSRLFVAKRIAAAHAAEHAAAFPGEPLPDMSSWPDNGAPGDPPYDALSAEERDAATRVFVQAGKAIAAYERTFRVQPNPLDAYLAGDFGALGPDQKYGLALFVRLGCMQCHWGPRLTDDAFHDTRTPTGLASGAADPGRLTGLARLLQSDFRGAGRWSDAPEAALEVPLSPSPSMLGQFKTPPLRGVADAHYLGHGGAFDQLSGIAEAYGHGGVPERDRSSAGARDPWLPTFGETAQWGLVPFLQTQTATLAAP
jgi:cytochrome c peroxidase